MVRSAFNPLVWHFCNDGEECGSRPHSVELPSSLKDTTILPHINSNVNPFFQFFLIFFRFFAFRAYCTKTRPPYPRMLCTMHKMNLTKPADPGNKVSRNQNFKAKSQETKISKPTKNRENKYTKCIKNV